MIGINAYILAFTLGVLSGYFVIKIRRHYWGKFFLRQELFSIRDSLWDAAREKDAFSDPLYQLTRSMLNASIAGVPYIFFPTMVGLVKGERSAPGAKTFNEELAACPPSPLKDEIKIANEKMILAVSTYLLVEQRYTTWATLFYLKMKKGTDAVAKLVSKWVQVRGPQLSGDAARYHAK